MFRWAWQTWTWLQGHWSDMSVALLGLISFLLALAPSRVANLEKRPLVRGTALILIAFITLTGLYRTEKEKDAFQRQIARLISGAQTEATKDDIRNLTVHLDKGFAKVVSAINGTKRKPPATKPPAANKPPLSTQPPIVRHIRFVQRRVPSNSQQFPYGLQVIVQTDVPYQNGGHLRIDFNGPIHGGDFFLAGRSVMLDVAEGVLPGGKSFELSFGFPAWTPENAIVVTVGSKRPVDVVDVRPVP